MTRVLATTLGRATTGLVALFVAGLILAPLTFTPGVWLGMLPFIGILGIAAIGQHVVIQQRGFDLSVGGIVSVAAVLISSQFSTDASPLVVAGGVIAVVLFGGAVGLVNGGLISYARVPAIVTTIGTNTILIGVALQLSGGVPSASPSALIAFTNARVLGVPIPAILLLLLAALAILLISRTSMGRRFVAVGVSPAAASTLAIKVPRYVLFTYAAAGMLFALAGIILAGVLASPAVHSGLPYMLATLAAVVLGSNPLNGDKGSILATMLGAVFLTYLNQLVLVLGFDYAVQNIVQAAIVLAGVAVPAMLAGGLPGFGGRTANSPRATATLQTGSVLQLRSLGKSFGPVQALKEVTLDIAPGLVHAIVGENGAGKSTLINLIVGVHQPTSGEIPSASRTRQARWRSRGFRQEQDHEPMPLSVAELPLWRPHRPRAPVQPRPT